MEDLCKDRILNYSNWMASKRDIEATRTFLKLEEIVHGKDYMHTRLLTLFDLV